MPAAPENNDARQSRSLKKMAANLFINDQILDANMKKLSTIASKKTGNQVKSKFSFAGKYESGHSVAGDNLRGGGNRRR